MAEPLVVRASKRSTMRSLFVCLGFVVVSVTTMFRAAAVTSGDARAIVLVVLGLSALFFIGLGLFLAWSSRSAKPLVVLGDEGPVVHRTVPAVGPLRWDEIAGVEVITVASQPFLSVVLTNPGAVINRQRSRVRRRVLRGSLRRGWGLASISLAALGDAADEVAQVIRSRASGPPPRPPL